MPKEHVTVELDTVNHS